MTDPFNAKKIQENHINNGYEVKQTHQGQKARYGDSFYEFNVKSDKPKDEVEEYCKENVKKCQLTSVEYLADERAGVKDFGDHFRLNYSLKEIGKGEYFYQVVSPSTH
jgi:hypothetical protein